MNDDQLAAELARGRGADLGGGVADLAWVLGGALAILAILMLGAKIYYQRRQRRSSGTMRPRRPARRSDDSRRVAGPGSGGVRA